MNTNILIRHRMPAACNSSLDHLLLFGAANDDDNERSIRAVATTNKLQSDGIRKRYKNGDNKRRCCSNGSGKALRSGASSAGRTGMTTPSVSSHISTRTTGLLTNLALVTLLLIVLLTTTSLLQQFTTVSGK